MKKFLFPLLLFAMMCSLSCEKISGKKYSVSGKAQKGPYIVGTIVTINELNNDLSQTGKSFTSSIYADDGSFSLDNVELKEGFALLTADGFYFSEWTGYVTSGKLTLQAIVDLSDQSTVNINVLTHLIKGRIEKLVKDGKSYTEANEQAHQEMLDFMGVNQSAGKNFSHLDISQSDELNGVLLAFSAIVQHGNYTAELTELLANLSSDFRNNGTISSNTLKNQLLDNAYELDMIVLRNVIQGRYDALGMSVTLPDFEKYIGYFIQKHSDTFYSSIEYPEKITIYTNPNPPAIEVSNLLYTTQNQYTIPVNNSWLALGAAVPLFESLTIKLIGTDINQHVATISQWWGGSVNGWYLLEELPNSTTWTSQRQNSLLRLPARIHLPTDQNGMPSPYTFTIEYFENNATTPTFSKTVTIEI